MRPEVYREMAAVQATHWWFSARRRILARLIEGLALPADAQLLEIGCGTGGNLAMLSRFGRLSAMEYDPVAREIAQAQQICTVLAGGLPEPVPFDEERFDLICLLDVLEHIRDDGPALARIRGLLKPGGRVLLTTPAYRWLWSAHDTAHNHHRRYTATALRRLAAAADLRVQRIGYYNTLLFPLIVLARLIQAALRREGGSDAALQSAPVNTTLEAVFAAERHVLPRAMFPFGTSVIAVLAWPTRPGSATRLPGPS